MSKLDLKKTLARFYKVGAKNVEAVNVPGFHYLMVDGKGDPNTSVEYQHAVEALFSLSYTLKFSVKKGEIGIDYAVMPLEGLWWADDMSAFTANDKSAWHWTMMIMQPDFITLAMVDFAKASLIAKKKDLPALNQVRFEYFVEGRAAQILHVGPFSEEGPTIERVHAFVANHGALSGKHHEIYLSDIRRAAPEKWKTIIRQPFTGV